MHFDRIYRETDRILEFKAKTLDEWVRWRGRLREKLRELLGGFDEEKPPLDVEVSETRIRRGLLFEKIVFRTRISMDVPVYVLKPLEAEGRLPAVVAVHGHGYGKDEIVGFEENGSERVKPGGYQKDFGLKLAEEGFLVVAPDQLGFGERREDEDKALGRRQSSCHLAASWAFMLGRTLVGYRVWDLMRVIDYLEARPDVDASRVGCMGISGGGTTVLFAAALDDRIKASVVSGYLNTFRDSILSVEHCICNLIPGILRYAEMPDIAALIAPKPLLIEAGTRDPIFPLRGVEKAYRKLRQVYGLLGVPDRLDIDIFEGEHEISGRKAYRWLKRWLTVDNPKSLLSCKAESP